MIYVVVICVIVAVLLATAVLRSVRVHSQADFLVAGRSLRWPVLIFTLLSSWIGAGSLFAGGENAYRNGFAALWQSAGGWFGLIVIALIAGRARRFAQFTVPDLLETRYNTAARIFATIAIVISYTMITSYQFKAGRRCAASDFSGAGEDRGHVHHRGIRDYVHGAGGDGIGGVSRFDYRGAGDGDRDHYGAAAVGECGRLGGGEAGASAGPFHDSGPADVHASRWDFCCRRFCC